MTVSISSKNTVQVFVGNNIIDNPLYMHLHASDTLHIQCIYYTDFQVTERLHGGSEFSHRLPKRLHHRFHHTLHYDYVTS